MNNYPNFRIFSSLLKFIFSLFLPELCWKFKFKKDVIDFYNERNKLSWLGFVSSYSSKYSKHKSAISVPDILIVLDIDWFKIIWIWPVLSKINRFISLSENFHSKNSWMRDYKWHNLQFFIYSSQQTLITKKSKIKKKINKLFKTRDFL